jgi:DNA-binding IclR family transcriptional regulator
MSASTLRLVLTYFETNQGAVSLPQLARTLGIERETLHNMLDFWVRKGKLRESVGAACTTCGSAAGCPFVALI